MPDLWMPGANRLDVGDHAPTDGGPAKAIAHITWDKNATAAAPADLVPYSSLQDYFGRNTSGKAAAPHILWNPFTGEFTQFFPADSRSRSLVDTAGGTRTNRAGSVVLQIEALFFPYCRVGGRVYARLADTPCLGWDRLHAWVRSWGVPDIWPMGRPVDFTSRRSESTWETKGGWYAHAHVPENDHQDPGSWPAFTQEEDMTPEERGWLQELHDLLTPYAGWNYKGKGETADAHAVLLNAADPTTVLGYRNAAMDKASVEAGLGHIPDVYGFITGTNSGVKALLTQVTAQNAAITALTTAVGDIHSGVDTATLVAAVQKAIADAVVDVDVTVHDATKAS